MGLQSLIEKSQSFFIALQYHTLFLNRRLLVLVDEEELRVIKVGGMLSDQHPTSFLVNAILESMQVRTDRAYALSYIQSKYVNKYSRFSDFSGQVVEADRCNFIISYSKILDIEKITKWKWGMGSVPYTGRLKVKTENKVHEFIILGNQNLDQLHDEILKNINAQNIAPSSSRR